MLDPLPRITISALKGGSGKTTVSLGLVSSWRERGYRVAPFKKGPDYIDSGWLRLAADRYCFNLDNFMMNDAQILGSFVTNSRESDISVIEGNRGLFDGLDVNGCCSTAELGKLLKSPVLLIVDVTMVTRTTAALVMGCQSFDPELKIVGVILNRVAGPRQASIARNAIHQYCGIPVLGQIPKLKGNPFPERHMGLVPHQEREEAEKAIAWARKVVEDNLNIEELWKLAQGAEQIKGKASENEDAVSTPKQIASPRIGFIRDSAFWFYYPENLSQLKSLGAELVEINAMADRQLPKVDALYIGGGFPETQAQTLAENSDFRTSLKKRIEQGLPVYAECGGLMYLGDKLILGDHRYPMVGALPLDFLLEKKPQGHGYTIIEVSGENPYYPEGETLKGHEFHYSRPLIHKTKVIRTAFTVRRGRGLDGERDGLCKGNLLATYTHLHASGTELWGKGLFNAALKWKANKCENFLEHS